LDRNPMYASRPQEIVAAIRAHLNGDGRPVDGLTTPIETLQRRAFRNWILLWTALILGFVVWVPAALVWLLLVRRHEVRESRIRDKVERKVDEELYRKEDRYLQNHLTTLVQIKPGLFRLMTLRLVLWLINFAASHIFLT